MISSGRISDIAGLAGRRDWSELNEKLKSLQPGARVSMECPPGVSIPRLRSTILTNARRMQFSEGWRLSTRTEGRTIHCFLAPL